MKAKVSDSSAPRAVVNGGQLLSDSRTTAIVSSRSLPVAPRTNGKNRGQLSTSSNVKTVEISPRNVGGHAQMCSSISSIISHEKAFMRLPVGLGLKPMQLTPRPRPVLPMYHECESRSAQLLPRALLMKSKKQRIMSLFGTFFDPVPDYQ